MQNEEEKLRNFNESCAAKEQNPRGIFQWLDYMQKNKPQTNALVIGLMLLIYGGQNIGWGIFNDHLEVQPWAGGYEDEGTVFWAIASWFIATCAGYLIGSLITAQFSKILIYIFASIMAAISCTLYIVGPASIYFIFPARIISGIAHGIVYLTVLIHASEVAVPKLRGMIVASAHLCVFVGVFISSSTLIPVYKIRSYEVDPTQLMGLIGLKCIVAGLLIAIFLNRESPVFLIKKYREEEAMMVLMRLRSESHETMSISHDFEEFHEMILEDNNSSLNLFKYWRSFAFVMLLKIVFVSSFNMPLNNYFLELAKLHFYDAEDDKTGVVLSGVRWAAMLLGMFAIDFKRLTLFFISTMSTALILLFILLKPISDESYGSVIVTIGFQLFAGIAIGQIGDIFSSDAVNTRVKPYFIAITSMLENLIQILLIVSYFYLKISIVNFMACFCLLLAVGATIGLTILPDTSWLSLRNARNKFLL